MTKPGRRPGPSGTREAIFTAAKEAFARQGYDATSLRQVARNADVDPSLIVHFFGTKAALFRACLALPIDPDEVVRTLLAGGVDGLGERIVRTFLAVWDTTPGQGPMLAMLRSAVSHEDSAAQLSALLTEALFYPLARGAGCGDPGLRASLLASQAVGMAFARYVLKLEPFASASVEVLAPALGPTLQRYLTGPLASGSLATKGVERQR